MHPYSSIDTRVTERIFNLDFGVRNLVVIVLFELDLTLRDGKKKFIPYFMIRWFMYISESIGTQLSIFQKNLPSFQYLQLSGDTKIVLRQYQIKIKLNCYTSHYGHIDPPSFFSRQPQSFLFSTKLSMWPNFFSVTYTDQSEWKVVSRLNSSPDTAKGQPGL